MKISRPNAPHDLESAADRNRSARRSSRPLLDPHGIYGTRTAARQRTARRRQAVQNLSILTTIALVVLGLLWWMRQVRVPRLARQDTTYLGGSVVAPPVRGIIGGKSVLAVPREDGSLILRWPAGQTVWRGEFALRAAPLIASDGVFAAAENGAVFSIQASAAAAPRVRWKWFAPTTVSTRLALFTAPTPPAISPESATAVSGAAPQKMALLLVADDEGNITALRASNGKPVWTQRLRAPAGTALTVASQGALAGRIWVPLGAGSGGFEGGVACVQATSGRVLWKVEAAAPLLPAPALDMARERLYCAGDDGSVRALDARTGRKLWQIKLVPADSTSALAVGLRGAVVLASDGKRLVLGGNDGLLRCLDSNTGAEIWLFSTGAPVRFGAAHFQTNQGRELLVCATESSTLWIIDVASGSVVNRISAAGPPAGVPETKGVLEAVSRDGWLEHYTLPR